MRTSTYITLAGLCLIGSSLQAPEIPHAVREQHVEQLKGTDTTVELPQQRQSVAEYVSQAPAPKDHVYEPEDRMESVSKDANKPNEDLTNEGPQSSSDGAPESSRVPSLERAKNDDMMAWPAPMPPEPTAQFSPPDLEKHKTSLSGFPNKKAHKEVEKDISREAKIPAVKQGAVYKIPKKNPLDTVSLPDPSGRSDREEVGQVKEIENMGRKGSFNDLERIQAQLEALTEDMDRLVSAQQGNQDSAQPKYDPSTQSPAPKKGVPDELQETAQTAEERRYDELFGGPLTELQYRRRNWMWLRCLTTREMLFDVGGMWFGRSGREVLKAVRKKLPGCGIMNWRFKYVNGQKWGDGKMSFNCFWGFNDQRDVVAVMVALAEEMGKHVGRNLHIYNCAGFEHKDTWYWEPYEWQRIKEESAASGS